MKLIVPPVFGVNEKYRHGVVRQVLLEKQVLSGRFVRFITDKATWLRFTPDAGGPDILLFKKVPDGFAMPTDVSVLVKSSLPAEVLPEIDAQEALWDQHPLLSATAGLDVAGRAQRARESWRGAFHYVDEDSAANGAIALRRPQVGALHAIHAHWSVSDGVATIVMPTGTGKTETMLATTVSSQCQRILVLVPTDTLRSQVAQKFVTLGILKLEESAILDAAVQRPVVGIMTSAPRDIGEVDAFFTTCNVVVTTSQLASRFTQEVKKRIASLCSHLFIDEAHHAEAPTWKDFKEHYADKRVLQFTATPFREDHRRIDGKIIYVYPLRKAQAEGYFRRIRFSPVSEFGFKKADRAIAQQVLKELDTDATGKHVAMARVSSTDRANQVAAIYQELGRFNPVVLHTKISTTERKTAHAKLRSGGSRIVVCVDMLGEGFDMPELKIAAFHDLRKSLAVTLQLAGRFTRARSDLGDPVFIANTASVDLTEELEKLYSQDPDWNELLPELSEAAIADEVGAQDFMAGFVGNLGGIPMKELNPSASTVVFQTACANWTPKRFRKGIRGATKYEQVHSSLNEKENTLVVITANRHVVPWTAVSIVQDYSWELFIAYWDRERQLLFIHGSSNSSEFKDLAKALAGDDVTLVVDPVVYRTFHGINRLLLTNVGLDEHFGRQIRYTGRMGADVGSRLSESTKKGARKAVLAGVGYENGSRTTIGAAKRGRVWSAQRLRVDTFTAWCRNIGGKIVDETIDPEEVLKGTLIPRQVDARPSVVAIGIDWPSDVLDVVESMTTVVWPYGAENRLTDLGIELIENSADKPIVFRVFTDEREVRIRLELFRVSESATDFKFVYERRDTARIRRGGERDLCEYFTEKPPTIWFADGSSLEGNLYVELVKALELYPVDKLVAVDWTGIDITKESQRDEKRQDSVQYRVIDILRKNGNYDVVFDDDGSGEAADVVAIRIDDPKNPKRIEVELYHCKFSMHSEAGARIDDLYVVCGQAQRSIVWLHNRDRRKDLFSHLLKRNEQRVDVGRPTRFEVGNDTRLIQLRDLSKRCELRLSVFAVQPGVSQAKVSPSQLTLLSVADRFLQETYQLDFHLWCSA
ncbi:MAG: DEAD/DEAH box helicase family protein [Acidovorax sp.]|nr:DEAD/DEAH box helicase family protein [Acidovorax sp.]